MSIWDRPATISEAIREWVWEVGQYPENIGCQWLVSDYDTVERNPHYSGPEQQHPNDDTPYEEWESLQLHKAYFSDGTPVALFDDANWGRNRRLVA